MGHKMGMGGWGKTCRYFETNSFRIKRFLIGGKAKWRIYYQSKQWNSSWRFLLRSNEESNRVRLQNKLRRRRYGDQLKLRWRRSVKDRDAFSQSNYNNDIQTALNTDNKTVKTQSEQVNQRHMKSMTRYATLCAARAAGRLLFPGPSAF